YENFGNVGKATILAVKAAMILEYGYSGNQLGLEYMKEAQELDPDHWEWNLLCGKIISRLRRVEGASTKKPTEEELEYLQKSVELYRGDASALVHLANVYRSISYFIFREKSEAENSQSESVEFRPHVQRGGRMGWSVSWRPQTEEEVNVLDRWRNPQQIPSVRQIIPLETDQKDYLQLAKNLYLEALKLEPNCPYNNARCAKGLWSMPKPYRDKDLAKEAILKAISLAPKDSLVNHYAGLFYEFCYDDEKALESYEKSFCDNKCNYPAEINYINLKLKTSCPGVYSPILHFQNLLLKYLNPTQTVQTLCHYAFYLYKEQKLYISAIENIVKAIKINPGSQILKTFIPGNYYGHNPQSNNMFDLLEEIILKCKNLPIPNEEDFINETLETVRKFRSEVFDEN
ncbi:hypothetical protein L9F63_004288, partial [Diploptera punctata]